MTETTDRFNDPRNIKYDRRIRLTVGEDGLNYTMGTSQAIAYERMLESQREDRLFNDHLAKHFTGGERGKEISDHINAGFSLLFRKHNNVCIMITAARTKLINDYLEKWINKISASG